MAPAQGRRAAIRWRLEARVPRRCPKTKVPRTAAVVRCNRPLAWCVRRYGDAFGIAIQPPVDTLAGIRACCIGRAHAEAA